MSDFTPGPWRIVGIPYHPAKWIFAGGWRLASVHYRQRPCSTGFLPSEAKFNARLIAAAPELYEALKGALWCLNDAAEVNEIEAYPITVTQIKAALALVDKETT